MGLWTTNASAVPSGCSGSPPECPLYDSWNRDSVSNNPPIYPVFTITHSWDINKIQDYHWNGGSGQDPITVNGSISLYDNSSGALIGSWAASTLIGYGNLAWEALPNVILNPGTYKIVDSDPASWAYSMTDYFHLPGDGPDWQPGVGFSTVYAATPEPSSILLISFGLVLLTFTRFHSSALSKIVQEKVHKKKRLVPCNINIFACRETVIYWRQLNKGGRHVTKVSGNTDQGGARRT
jgi:hypothetical protein